MRGEAALALQDDLPLLLLSAVAQPLAALLPYGCGTPLAGAALPVLWQCGLITVYRRTHQCGERSNAAFRRQSAAEGTSHAPHDSKARLQDVTICRRFMAKPCTPHPHCAARAVIRAANCQCAGSRGKAPRPFSWGCKGDILFLRKRISPFAASPHGVGPEAALPRCTPPAPYGRKKKQPSRAAFLPRPRRESCPNCQYGILIPISPLFSLDNMQY